LASGAALGVRKRQTQETGRYGGRGGQCERRERWYFGERCARHRGFALEIGDRVGDPQWLEVPSRDRSGRREFHSRFVRQRYAAVAVPQWTEFPRRLRPVRE